MKSIKIKSNGSTSGNIIVAFATSDLENIDSHFGSAKQFAVYEISKESTTVCEIIKIDTKDTDLTVELLKGIDIVYFTTIGAIAAAKIINNGIFPIKYLETVSIEDEIKK